MKANSSSNNYISLDHQHKFSKNRYFELQHNSFCVYNDFEFGRGPDSPNTFQVLMVFDDLDLNPGSFGNAPICTFRDLLNARWGARNSLKLNVH